MRAISREISLRIEQAASQTPHGSMWRHYKGGTYVVTGHSYHTEDDEILVHYRRIGGPDFSAVIEANIVFARPLVEWTRLREGGLTRFERVA